MSKQLSTFADVVHKSGLVLPASFEKTLEDFKSSHPDNLEVETFAEVLVEKGLVTKWQAEHLLTGKYKGFFVDQYKILNLIGRGGHASVYQVEHTGLNLHRVMKVISQKKLQKASSLKQRFLREAQATAKLDHQNVIRCYDVVFTDKISYIILEYCRGMDLEKVIRKNGPPPFERSVGYIRQASIGLEYTRQNGLIHRDIKPGNLLLTDDGVVKILDLGLAMLERDDEEDGSLTEAYQDNLGTADYIAPEQALSSHEVDFRADIYSLGCTLYHLIVGRPPFHTGSIVQRIARHQTVMPTHVKELRPDCPDAIADLCWRMIQKDPAHRFGSYPELIQQCNAILSGLGQGSSEIAAAGLIAGNDLLAQGGLEKGDGVAPGPDLMSPAVDVLGAGSLSPDESGSSFVGTDPMGAPSSSIFPIVPSLHESTSDLPTSGNSSSKNLGATWSQVQKSDPASDSTKPRVVKSASSNSLLRRKVKPSVVKKKLVTPEEVAYQKFIRRERLKTIWVVIGLLVGLGIAVGGTVAYRSMENLSRDPDKPRMSRERAIQNALEKEKFRKSRAKELKRDFENGN